MVFFKNTKSRKTDNSRDFRNHCVTVALPSRLLPGVSGNGVFPDTVTIEHSSSDMLSVCALFGAQALVVTLEP